MTPSNYPDHLDQIAFPEGWHSVRRFSLRLVEEPQGHFSPGQKCSTPHQALWFLQAVMEGRPWNEFGVLYLSERNEAMGFTMSASPQDLFDRHKVEPRLFLAQALLMNATGIVTFEHVAAGQGTAIVGTPSLGLARRFRNAATLLGLEHHDHLILGDDETFESLRLKAAL